MRSRFLAPLLLACALAPALRADDAPPEERGGEVDWLAACPAPLLEALRPLVEARRAEGLRCEALELDPGAGPAAARERVLARVAAARPRFLLLVGDVGAIPEFVVADAITDRPYGDLDRDGLPDVAVGRIPAGDPATLSRVVAHLLAYEREAPAGPWRKECALLAGEGGFGPAADAAIEHVFGRAVAEAIHPGYDVELLWASPRSPFCYPPEELGEYVAGRIERGALFMAWVGHGQVQSVDQLSVRQPDGSRRDYPILDVTRVPALRTARAPVFVAIACYTGRYADAQTSVGEALLLSGQGPVAFLGASEVSHPLCNALLGLALVDELLSGVGPLRLGPALDRARVQLVRPKRQDGLWGVALGMGKLADPSLNLEREMPRHVDMYNLLGDPATRLVRPGEAIELEAPGPLVPGQALRVAGRLPAGLPGVTVTLEEPRDRRVSATGEVDRLRFARANDRVLATALLRAGPDGRFAGELRVPAGARGRLHLKAFASAEGRSALGALVLGERAR
jgi:hypothetical protein